MTLTWFLLALAPDFFYAISNLIDQYIIRLKTTKSPATFLCLSGITCLPVLLFLLPLVVTQGGIGVYQALWIMLTAMIFSAAVIPYFYAIEKDDAHNAIPVYQTVPVFVAALSWTWLGEALNISQISGGLIVVVAAAISMIDTHQKSFNARPFLLILLSSLLFAFYMISLRVIAADIPWFVVTFWLCAGWFIMGFGILISRRSIRSALRDGHRITKGKLFVMSGAQEFGDVAASACLTGALAFSAVPAAVTTLMGGLQPFVILLLSFIAARMIPSIYSFDLTRREIVQKAVCFTAMLFGLSVVTGVIALP